MENIVLEEELNSVEHRTRIGNSLIKDITDEADQIEAVYMIYDDYDYEFKDILEEYPNLTVAQVSKELDGREFIYDIDRINRILNTKVSQLNQDDLREAFIYTKKFKPVKGSLTKFVREYADLLVGEVNEIENPEEVEAYLSNLEWEAEMSAEIDRLVAKDD